MDAYHQVAPVPPPLQLGSAAVQFIHALDCLKLIQYDTAINLFEQVANSKTSYAKNAQYQLGLIHEHGLGEQQLYLDMASAAKQYERAHHEGHVGATFRLGMLMYHGVNGHKAYGQAKLLFTKIAQCTDQNNQFVQILRRDACFYLGHMHEQGYGADVDDEATCDYYQDAADLGHPVAMFRLARNYADRIGVEEDGQKARVLYVNAVAIFEKEVAIQDNRDFFFYLGLSYANGYGVTLDLQRAAFYYYKAAELGHIDAAYDLGLMLLRGDGVGGKDYGVAHKLLTLAHQGGHRLAKFYIEQINDFIKTSKVQEPCQHQPKSKPITKFKSTTTQFSN